MATALFTHPDCVQHEMGAGHPESPLRLKAILAALEASGLAAQLRMHEAPEASREHLERVHHAAHVDLVFDSAPDRGYAYLDPDTSMNPKSLSAALRAAGAVVAATDMVMSGEVKSAFCAVRPPGHHATRDRPMGFCLFNNVAIGAMHAIEAHGLERVAVLDFDVHHGNGTEDAFHEDPRVMLCSTFQHPYYPYSAGFDAHRDDPLAYLKLDDEDYRWVTEKLVEVAERHAEGRVVSTLEGGYNTAALGRCVVEHVRVLAG
jgi:acetoin utilization deacetylase AcuC-like enzyme